MGLIIARPDTVHHVLGKLNERFGPGEPLKEMTAIHQDHKIFSKNYSLKHAYRLLNIVPDDHKERDAWYKYLDHLKSYPSDQAGVTGHDRIVKARQENLESARPLPMHSTMHRSADDKRVLVSRGYPHPLDHQEYMIISHPVSPAGAARRTTRKKSAA